MSKITKNSNELELAGLCELPNNITYKYGYKPGEWPTQSKDLHIKMYPAKYEQLTDPAFIEVQASKLFNWMKDNLPHGIYVALLAKMNNHRDRLSSSKRLFDGELTK